MFIIEEEKSMHVVVQAIQTQLPPLLADQLVGILRVRFVGVG